MRKASFGEAGGVWRGEVWLVMARRGAAWLGPAGMARHVLARQGMVGRGRARLGEAWQAWSVQARFGTFGLVMVGQVLAGQAGPIDSVLGTIRTFR